MKKVFLFALLLGGSVIYCSSQNRLGNSSSFVSGDSLKSKKTPVVVTNQPVMLVADPVAATNGGQFLEYKTNEGSNIPSTNTTLENQGDNQLVIFPITAEGYTDPSYILNKQKSIALIQRLESSEVPVQTNEELVLDLQNKIKAIKGGVVVDPVAIKKLPFYEEELQLLLKRK